ncbi:MAG TPA: MBL fold metallo-hydrolase, partial [Blastocatellia bacterium]|nr:MBL fold metallo-hydrolase [Blastocatellia bacterium]
MRIEKISVPTPFPVGPINVYLIIDEPLTLIDTGPKTDEALATLKSEFARLGFRLSDLRQIILTHTHEDHCGLAHTLQKASGARVYVHEWELHNLESREMTRAHRPLLERAGVPVDEIEKMKGYYQKVKSYGDVVEDLEAYLDEQEFVFASGSLRVIHTPGHTPGSCSLLRESNRLLLTGDTVLKNITPNPVLNPDPVNPERRFPSLGEYLVSLARIRTIAPTQLMTSHGEDIFDYEEHFTRQLRHIRERQNRVINLVPKNGI